MNILFDGCKVQGLESRHASSHKIVKLSQSDLHYFFLVIIDNLLIDIHQMASLVFHLYSFSDS